MPHYLANSQNSRVESLCNSILSANKTEYELSGGEKFHHWNDCCGSSVLTWSQYGKSIGRWEVKASMWGRSKENKSWEPVVERWRPSLRYTEKSWPERKTLSQTIKYKIIWIDIQKIIHQQCAPVTSPIYSSAL